MNPQAQPAPLRPLRPVLDILKSEHGLGDTARKLSRVRAAAELLAAELAKAADALVDGRYIELSAVRLLDSAATCGVRHRDMQFLLNVIRGDVYTFGGRRGTVPIESADVVGLMRQVARRECDGAGFVPVHRFEAALMLQPGAE